MLSDILRHANEVFNSIRQYRIIYPQNRLVTAEQLITWARDDIENGDSDLFDDSRNVQTVEDAIAVLHDSGSVTVRRDA